MGMGITLVVNPGSSSRKYALYRDGEVLCQISFEETSNGFCWTLVQNGVQKVSEIISAKTFAHSLQNAISYACEHSIIKDKGEITDIGIRIVTPGSLFTQHATIDKKYITALEEAVPIAPLHIPGTLNEIESCQSVLPEARLVGVSDSAFHTTIPEHISTISIPQADAQRFDIKRFGYHGLSFASISRRLPQKFGSMPRRVIVLHVGSGVSITALQDGVSVSTSMGYSPASGLIMGGRGGDVTGGVVAALSIRKKLQGEKIYEYLYKESGFKGVAGVRDLRLLLERVASCDPNAQKALDMFIYQVHSWIGAHAVLLGGVDAIVMTATASVRNPHLRSLLLSKLELFGVELDVNRNEALVGKEGFIHAESSAVQIAVMNTDEMGEIDRIVREI